MDISLKSALLFSTVILTGLSAGFFYAWSISVIPGTKTISDQTYLEAMQAINRAILNPKFFMIFFGTIISLSVASIDAFHSSKWTFVLLLTASITYLFGTIGVTGLGNVPLNDQLDVLQLPDGNLDFLSDFRKNYERSWNRLHLIRTVFAITTFVLTVLALLIETKK